MRIVRVLLRQYKHPKHLQSRTPQDPNKVPFKPILPQRLRDRGLFCFSIFTDFNILVTF